MEDDPRLPALVDELCILVGKGSTHEALYLSRTLREAAAQSTDADLDYEAEWKWLAFQLGRWMHARMRVWTQDVTLKRGRQVDHIPGATYKVAVWILLQPARFRYHIKGHDIYWGNLTADTRRREAIALLGLRHCGVQNWRKHVEPQFMTPFARQLLLPS